MALERTQREVGAVAFGVPAGQGMSGGAGISISDVGRSWALAGTV